MKFVVAVLVTAGLAALAVFVVGGGAAGQSGGFEFESTEITVLPVPRVPQVVIYHAVNASPRKVRVVSTSTCCGLNCVFGVSQELPVDVPPGGVFDIECEVIPSRVGEVSGVVRVFVDDLGLREHMLIFRSEP